MTEVIGIFQSPAQANRAIADLLTAGLTKNDISLIMSDKAKKEFSSASDDTGDRTLKDAAVGAGAGAVFAGLIMGLTAVSAVTVPGLPLLLVGPLVAALEGMGMGAAVGGIAGALSALGITAVEAKKYEDELKAGRAVVIVHSTDDQKIAAARTALALDGASLNSPKAA